MQSLYYTLVYPHLSYCNILWGNTHFTYLNRLFLLQKKLIRIISGSSYLDHTALLFTELQILPVFDIYTLQLGTFVFKYFRGILPPIFDVFFRENNYFHSHFTRQSSSLHIDFSRVEMNRKSVRISGAILWNTLSSNIKKITSLKKFVKHLKALLLGK